MVFVLAEMAGFRFFRNNPCFLNAFLSVFSKGADNNNSGGQLCLLLACVWASKLTVGALLSSAYMSSDSSGWMIFMNGYNREVDPHPRHGYGIDVEGLSWLISSISTSDKALERKKENRNYLSEEIFSHYYNLWSLRWASRT